MHPANADSTALLSVMSPMTTSVGTKPNGSKTLRTFATSRTINLTSCPWAASAAAVCEPVKPVPPVTSTFTVGMLEVETAIHSRMKKCRGHLRKHLVFDSRLCS
jgi:hypothetical protein